MAENWDTVSPDSDDDFLTHRDNESPPPRRQSRPRGAQKVRFDVGPSESSYPNDSPTRDSRGLGNDGNYDRRRSPSSHRREVSRDEIRPFPRFLEEWRDFDYISPDEGIDRVGPPEGFYDASRDRRRDSQYRDYDSGRRPVSRGPSLALDSDRDPYDEDYRTYYRRTEVIIDDEPSRSPSPSRHMPSRTSWYHAASPYGHRRLRALRERVAEKKNVIMDLNDYIHSKRDRLDTELDLRALPKEELEQELGRQQRMNEGFRSLLRSCLEELEEYQHKDDIREKRLATLEMDHDDAVLQDESLRTDNDTPGPRSIEDLPRGTTREEHTTERLRRIREERTALEEEAKEAQIREKVLQEKIDDLRDVLAEETQKEAEYRAAVEGQGREQRQTEEEGRQDIKHHEDRLHELGRELQSLMREELEVEESLRRPWQSHQPYDPDGEYGDEPLAMGGPPPRTYVSLRQPPPPYTPGGDDDTWAMLDEDRWYDGDTYPLTFDDVEKAGLSVNLPLNMAAGAAPPEIRDENSLFSLEALAWRLHRVALSDQQSETQLTVVHASEYSAGGTGFGKTTLICPAGPQKPDIESAVQMRWLHVKQPSLKFKTLEQLVLNCPFLTEALRTVAIEAMEKVKEKFSVVSDCGAFLEPGSILRFLGRYNDRSSDDPDSDETEPVLFLSAPFLNLQPDATREPSQDDYRPRTLLQFLYGYDIGGLRENGQVVQKLGAAKSKKDMLHVSQIWCFLIGSKILITLSDKSASEIHGKSIVTAARTWGDREPLLIRLTDERDRQYPVVIERDYNYADFLRYAVSLVADQEADASDYELFDSKTQVLTPKRWIQILGSSDSQVHAFFIRMKNQELWDQSDHGREGSTGGYSRSRSALAQSRQRSRPPDSTNPYHRGPKSHPATRSYDRDIRNREIVSKDFDDYRLRRSAERVWQQKSRTDISPLSRDIPRSGSASSGRRSIDEDPRIGSHPPISPRQFSPVEEPQGNPSKTARHSGGSPDRPPPEALIPEDRDSLHGEAESDWSRDSPRDLSPIEELTTPSTSSKFGTPNIDAAEKPARNRSAPSKDGHPRGTPSSPDAADSGSGGESGSPDIRPTRGRVIPEATSEPDAQASKVSPGEPGTRISISEPWNEYAQSILYQNRGFSSRSLPAQVYRDVERETCVPPPAKSKDDTSVRCGKDSRLDVDMTQARSHIDQEIGKREGTVSGSRWRPRGAVGEDGPVYNADDNGKATASSHPPYYHSAPDHKQSATTSLVEHFGGGTRSGPLVPRSRPRGDYRPMELPAENGRARAPPGIPRSRAREYVRRSSNPPHKHSGPSYAERPLSPTRKSPRPLIHARSRDTLAPDAYSKQSGRRSSSGSGASLPYGVPYGDMSRPATSMADIRSRARSNFATDAYPASVNSRIRRKVYSEPGGKIINDPTVARKAPPELYDLESDEDQEEGSEAEIPEGSSSDTSSEPADRLRSVDPEDPEDPEPTYTISSALTDTPSLATKVKIEMHDDDKVPVRRLVLQRRPGFHVAVPTDITVRKEPVEDIHLDGPFDSFGPRLSYRTNPKLADDAEVDWVDEFVIDTMADPPHQIDWVVNLEWPPSPEEEAELPAQHVPFFKWPLKKEKDERTPEEVEKTLFRILSALNKSLSQGAVTRLYSRVSECTMKDLPQRHEFLRAKVRDEGPATSVNAGQGADDDGYQQTAHSSLPDNTSKASTGGHSAEEANEPGPRPANGLESPEATSPSEAGEEDRGPDEATAQQPIPDAPGTGTPSEANTAGSEQGQRQSVQTTSHEEELMKRLFDISREIFGTYLPSQGSPLIHHLCLRFWGAIDDIFRQIIWDSTHSHVPEERQVYVIRDFGTSATTAVGEVATSSSKSKSWFGCASCKDSTQYPSAMAAIEHLHSHHLGCSRKSKRPYDDPCFVWLQLVEDSSYSHRRVPGIGNAGQVEDFLSQLLPISSYVRELHSLVASTQAYSPKPPPLPAKVVRAFEQLMAMYMIQAQWLSLNNRRSSSRIYSKAVQDRAEDLMLQGEAAKKQVYDYLQDAKKDIVLMRGTSRHYIDGLGVEAVGAEFLVLAIMVSLQNRSVLTRPASTAPERADFIELYQRYTSQLRFQANRRPKKRVFLDIHGLVEELDALEGMVKAQTLVMRRYLQLLAPGSTRTTNATRVGLYKIERAYGDAQQRALRLRQDNLRILQEKSLVLKEQVKQIIEILEEDHGKAIRVFTFVTLLFLPLSFVSSFMGMNTKDVRDMEFSQTIFWMTGLPVTAVVITLAMVYAYRGAEVGDWVWRRMHPRRRRRQQDLSTSSRMDGVGPGWPDEQQQQQHGAGSGGGMVGRGPERSGGKGNGMINVDSALVDGPGQRGRQAETLKRGKGMWMEDKRRRLLRWRRQDGQASEVPRRATGDSMRL